ncbi:c-type cytochrome [Flavobacterium sp.]|uniref:c-type cytochrome n=1 Tax=Flavobacterium sp. TaxID=239 RepID=UPI0038FC3778
MNTFNKSIYRILIITSGFIIVVIGIICFYFWNIKSNNEFVCGSIEPEFVCGNASINLSEKAKKGKEIFNSNCAACHKLNKNITGPALSKIDSTKLWNWLTEKITKADTTMFSKMKIDYHKMMWNKSLNETQLNELYEYTKNE